MSIVVEKETTTCPWIKQARSPSGQALPWDECTRVEGLMGNYPMCPIGTGHPCPYGDK